MESDMIAPKVAFRKAKSCAGATDDLLQGCFALCNLTASNIVAHGEQVAVVNSMPPNLEIGTQLKNLPSVQHRAIVSKWYVERATQPILAQ
jgi:hypothetical protein